MLRSKFLSVSLTALIITVLFAGAAVQGGNIHLTFDAAEYRVIELPDGRQMIEMEGFHYMLEPGKPMLPAQTYMIAIPPGAEVTSVNLQPVGTVELQGTFRIRPADPFMPDSDDPQMRQRCRQIWQDNYTAVYSTDAPYPAEAGAFLGTGGLRKYSVARVSFFPFAYNPQSGKVSFTPSVDVTIEYNEGPNNDPHMQKLMRDTRADKLAEKLFVNYKEAADWYQVPEGSSYEETYSTLVIYGEGLDEPAAAFCSGFQIDDAHIVTAGHCLANSTGSDNAEKIRNYLIEKYAEWAIEYVVLMGDLSQIPMRMCFPDPTYHYPGSDYCPPTDYYYSDLTGDWDSDGDGYYGEYGEDDVDFIPEVQVGRIPYNDSLTVHTIVDKLIAFQHDQGDWKNNALLIGAMQNYADEDDSDYLRTDGADLMVDMISGMLGEFTYTTQYEKAGIDPCPHPSDYPLTHANVVSEWSTGEYGVVNWWGHGSQYGAYRKYWNTDDGDGIPETVEMAWEMFIGTGDANSLDDSHSSIIFSCSCNNGWPEYNNLAKNLLKRGSAGIVTSTRVSWYSVGWTGPSWGGNASLDYYFFDNLITGPQDVGTALTSTRIYYYNHFMYWGWASAQNLYNFILYGAPQVVREGVAAGCCTLRGDVDDSGQADVLDIDFFIDWLFREGIAPGCTDETDVDGNGQGDVLDVDYFINYLYRSGADIVPCP